MISRAVATLDRRTILRRLGALGVAVTIVLLIVVAFLAVRLTGGSPNPLNHLAYPPILLAAFVLGWRWALVTAVALAIVLGPMPALFGLPNTEGPAAWMVRGAVLLGVGVLVGGLFDHLELAAHDARAAGRRIAHDEARKVAMLQAALDAVVGCDSQGMITEFNPAAEEMFGYRLDEILGKPLVETIIPEADRARHRAAFARYLRTEQSHILDHRLQMEGRHATGRLFPIELTIYRVPIAGPPAFGAFIRDLTETRRIEEHLIQAQKMESIGLLAGGIAHDFNNLLTAIGGYAELIGARPDLPEGARSDVQQISAAADRAISLTSQLLAFSRRQILQPVSVDLNQAITELEPMLRRLMPEDVEIEARCDPDLWNVLVDPGQLTQVVLNLVVNARDAMPSGGTVRVAATNIEFDDDGALAHPGIDPGRYVTLTVTDSGSGMDAATRERIFDPFFTTKGPGKGTGLGLATVYGIVRQSGGHIWVYSEPGKGSVFRIYLPRADEAAVERPRSRTSIATGGGSETVLVVEDDPGVRRFVETVLRGRGYRVLSASGAEVALDLAQTRGPIDLLVTDVVMPGTSGVDLAARLRDRCPGLKVLFVSGYTDDAIVRQGVLAPSVAFLSKPFSPQALTERVRAELDGPDR